MHLLSARAVPPPSPSFPRSCRHEIYEGYKGQRASCPEEIKEAIPRLQQLLRAMAIPFIQVGGP